MRKTTLLLLMLGYGLNAQSINFETQSVPANGQYKICVVDMNGDHLDDIVSVSNGNIHILYQNEDQTFTGQNFSVANSPYLPGWSMAAGDFNKDGYNDLLYGSGSGVSFVTSHVSAMSLSYNLTYQTQYIFSQRTNFVDINNDGNLDAYVCHDVAPSVYFINENNQPVFNQGGLGDHESGGHYGSIWTDYNNDGHIDLYIAKCGGDENRRRNQLYRNNGDGTFTDVAVEANLASTSEQWSSAWGDFNNDGWLDVFNGKNAQMGGQGSHELMMNNGDGTFSNVTIGSGFDVYNGTSREHYTFDFNNDGYLDIAGNGNRIFLNNGDMTFTPINVPFSDAAIGDLNNDGFLDAYAFGNVHYNSGNDNNWFKVTTIGTESNRNGIGARVEIYSNLGKQIRDVRSGEGFTFMSTLNTHFGIGQDTEIEKLIIRWPSGIVDEVVNPTINSTLVVVEGETAMSTNELNKNKIKLYPNPVKNTLYLDGDFAKNTQIELYNVAGVLVKNTKLINHKLDVADLPNGVYILVTDQDGKRNSTKFIKK